jgi:anti-anti-sigma factor
LVETIFGTSLIRAAGFLKVTERGNAMSEDVIRMPKRFDYASGFEFNAALSVAMDKYQEIKLDCARLEYIDSAGIGLLVMANKKAQSADVKLVIINLHSTPKEILQLANLQKLIEIRG